MPGLWTERSNSNAMIKVTEKSSFTSPPGLRAMNNSSPARGGVSGAMYRMVHGGGGSIFPEYLFLFPERSRGVT